MRKQIILSTAYFAPIEYFSILLSDDCNVIVERHENFNKQSYRNRCTIYAANGLLNLVAPVVKMEKPKMRIDEVKISYSMQWQKQHFKAIESAYRRSPFYEFYVDELIEFFTHRYEYIYELNMHIMRKLCELINIPCDVEESSKFIKSETCKGIVDMRYKIHPKVKSANYDKYAHYTQVFGEKWGFKPNLSILDLLFNAGPDAKEYLFNVLKTENMSYRR